MDKKQSGIVAWFKRFAWKKLGFTILSLLLSLLVGGVILEILGYNALETYQVIITKALSDFGQVLKRSTPLMLSALAVAIPIKCGMFNLGGEGQMITGAFAAAIVGTALQNCPIVIHPILCILVAAIVGGLVGFLAAWLKVRFGAPEVVVTLMFNYIISYIAEYLTMYVFRGSDTSPRTAYIAETAKIPLIEGQKWGYALIIAVIICLACSFIMNRTAFGMELKSAGLNRKASRYLGINVGMMALASMAIGGALAGMGGALEVLGSKYSYYHGYFDGYGFDGVAISYMAMGEPIPIIFTTLIISIIRTGMSAVERNVGVSAYFGTALQGIIITFLVCPYVVQSLLRGGGKLVSKLREKKVKKA